MMVTTRTPSDRTSAGSTPGLDGDAGTGLSSLRSLCAASRGACRHAWRCWAGGRGATRERSKRRTVSVHLLRLPCGFEPQDKATFEERCGGLKTSAWASPFPAEMRCCT